MMNTATNETIARKPSLLFVDDEPSILTALRVVFRTGYDVTVTTDGFEAVELLKTKRFDVIVSDQRMPKMTGVELLRHALDLSPNTIRVLLTGYSDTDAILGAINDVEVHRFLQKPWDNARLKQVVNEAIELARNVSETTTVNETDLSVPATDDKPKKLADVVPLPVQHRANPAIENASPSLDTEPTPPSAVNEKDTVLIVDSKAALFAQTQAEMSGKVDVVHAANVIEVFNVLERMPVSTMVCSFDVQSEADRTFIQMLKKEHPYIFVVAVCDSTDSTRLIELINQAKIFRFVKKPVSMSILSRYIMSAVAQAVEIRKNPALIRRQHADEISDSVAKSSSAQLLRDHFARINKTLAPRLSKLFSFFHRK
jgi:serine/threonine-protein kinase